MRTAMLGLALLAAVVAWPAMARSDDAAAAGRAAHYRGSNMNRDRHACPSGHHSSGHDRQLHSYYGYNGFAGADRGHLAGHASHHARLHHRGYYPGGHFAYYGYAAPGVYSYQFHYGYGPYGYGYTYSYGFGPYAAYPPVVYGRPGYYPGSYGYRFPYGVGPKGGVSVFVGF